MRFRITIVLMLAIGGLTAIAVGTVLFISASASVKNTLELMRARAQLTISAVETGVVDHLAPAQNLIVDLTTRLADGSLDIDDREQLVAVLSGALAPAPQIGGVVVWKPTGLGQWVMRGENGRSNVSLARGQEQEGFEAFVADINAAPGIQWSQPFYRDGQPFITIAGAIRRDGAYGGTVATGVSLVALSRFMRDLAEEGMTAFVLYGDDKVLAHPAMLDPEIAQRLSTDNPLPSTDEVGDPVLANFADLEVADLPSRDQFELRESDTFKGEEDGPRDEDGEGPGEIIISVASTAFGPVPWNIGVHVPVEAVAQQMKRLIGSILISIGLFIVSIIAALFLARRIARPIRAVSAAATRIERLELDDIGPLPRSRIRELDEQSVSFNRMIGGLRWFQAYVPQTLVRRLMQSSEGPAADAHEATLSVMFTDIIGFTPLSEAMPPKEVAALLNRHFELLNGCIEAEEGTLDKYIGDATMAFWGAPEPTPDHAARACRAALAIGAGIAARAAAGETPAVRVKVSLHVGPLIVGNIGAQSRMNYTVIGDTVNVCSRIESLAGEFDDGRPAIILVSGDVVSAVGDAFRFEPLGERVVKGRAQPVEIWRLVGEGDGI